jgi:predicted nucleic acid-binding protein
VKLYLDTSALVKLYVDEEGSPSVRGALDQADFIATSAIAYLEAQAAFFRRRREKGLSAREYRRIIQGLDADWTHYLVLEVTQSLIRDSARFAEVYALRASDAVHLASAVALRSALVEPVAFASWNLALERAAKKAGLKPLRRTGQ